MRTVRDFKRFVLAELDAVDNSQFTHRSRAHLEFWNKLNRIGARNIKTQRPEQVPDIDATVELTDDEWAQLETELNSLG